MPIHFISDRLVFAETPETIHIIDVHLTKPELDGTLTGVCGAHFHGTKLSDLALPCRQVCDTCAESLFSYQVATTQHVEVQPDDTPAPALTTEPNPQVEPQPVEPAPKRSARKKHAA